MTIYLDCNATAPPEPDVAKVVFHFLQDEYGNAGSRTHEYGNRAKVATEKARNQIATSIEAEKDEVVFTSGATESDNIAILGLEKAAKESGKIHIVTSEIEHKAVLEPIGILESRGFEVSYVKPNKDCVVEASQIREHLRDDTFLVSIMHVNNETGAIQPVEDIADILKDTDVFFHVDAAQGFGKDNKTLRNSRIDLISISGHKVYGPKGVGALITRRRNYKKPPISPLMYGGGQEKGIRPGTLPVALIAGFGLAAEITDTNSDQWWKKCSGIKENAIRSLKKANISIHCENNALPNTLNFSVPGVNSEAAMVTLKGQVAISNGSACTSSSYTPSHVLKAMGLNDEEIDGALRLSWCHMTEEVDWDEVTSTLMSLM
jgi:cysteine desulfurase